MSPIMKEKMNEMFNVTIKTCEKGETVMQDLKPSYHIPSKRLSLLQCIAFLNRISFCIAMRKTHAEMVSVNVP